MKKILLIGGGGHCRSCIAVINSKADFKIAGIVDNKFNNNEISLPYPIIGNDYDLPTLAKKYKYMLITIGQIKESGNRIKLFKKLIELGIVLPKIYAKTSTVIASSTVGRGTIIMHNAFVNAFTSIGDNCILNTSCIIEHDSSIGNHCHISTGAVVNGDCHLGEAVFVGSNCVVNNGVEIASNIIIGSGSVVNKNLDSPGIYAGNPVRRLS